MRDSVNKVSMRTIIPLWVTAVALTDGERRVLVQQRPPGKSLAGLWEFPGGKIEPGETPEAALVRELHEELGIEVDAVSLAPLSFVSTPLGERHLTMLLYRCHDWSGVPRALHATALRWCLPSELATLAMPPADVPLVRAIIAAVPSR